MLSTGVLGGGHSGGFITGTGAKFSITRTATAYSAIAERSGQNYAVGNKIKINGAHLGGISTSHDLIIIDLKTCGMSKGQIISLTKMWCDDNPDKTHFSFAVVVYRALLPLPTKSIKDCMER